MGFQLFRFFIILFFSGYLSAVSAEIAPIAPAFGGESVDILPVDEAFVLQTIRRDGKLEVLWQISPGHYLYRHRLAVKGSERLGTPEIPAGLAKTDEYFGDVQVYYDALILEVSLEGDESEQITIEYQGCSDAGICYPPQKRQISL